MKKAVLVGLAAASVTLHSTTAVADGFADIQFWAGSGANEAALVIDWKDGKSAESLLWGYRWDGTATGTDMLLAVVNADPRLFAHFGTFDFGSGPALSAFGIGYDLNESGGFGVTPGLAFSSGGLAIDPLGSPNASDARVALDSTDHWLEGWNTGFWNYVIRDSELDPWTNAAVGAADRVLANGYWDAYGFAANFISSDPSTPVAVTPVPEPATTPLLIIGTAILAWAGRRKS